MLKIIDLDIKLFNLLKISVKCSIIKLQKSARIFKLHFFF